MIAAAPARLLLDGETLTANWTWLATQSGGAVCGAAVKADGYGLGAVDVVRRLAAAGCRDFFVATWAEAEALGSLPTGAALSVLHGVRADDMAAARVSAARPVLNSAQQVARWRESGGGACDVMVDTGMNRLGLSPAEACSGLLEGLPIETLMSHLACADEPGHSLTRRQQAAFAAVRAALPARRYSLANSAGIMLGADYAFDLTRPGLAVYGGIPVPGDAVQAAAIRPVAAIEAAVLQVRDVAAGNTVGYGATWRADRPSRIAIVNLGYGDGYLRPFARAGFAGDEGSPLPIRGRISMDLIAIDVTQADVAEGDWLPLRFDLPALAQASGLSQYELLTGLGHRFERRWR